MVLPFGLASDQENAHPSAPPPSNLQGMASMRGGIDNASHLTVSTGVPIIPSPYIDFILVNNDDRYMLRCERKAVLENSVELAKLIHAGPNSGRKGDNHFQILNVDKNDFELVVRYLETKFVKYRDHMHILKILELANRFNCPDLIIHCIRELDLQLTSATVIDIFRSLWFYSNIAPTRNLSNTNAVITAENAESGKRSKSKGNMLAKTMGSGTLKSTNTKTVPFLYPFTAEEYGVALLTNALQLIDMHAELALTKRDITELRFEQLEMIAKREALQLATETVLFNCLADWSSKECQRRNLDLTPENRRRVLGPLCYAPRYLLMSLTEFRRACERVELLDSVEISLITEALKSKKPKNLSPEQLQMLEKFRTPRPEFAAMPIHLSDRSNPKNYPKKMRRADKNTTGEEGCWERFELNCLTVFVCIFE